MKFVYIGDSDSPQEVTTHGKLFKKNGDPVEVTGMAATKLSNNSHFKAIVDESTAISLPESPLTVDESPNPPKLPAPKRRKFSREF